MQTNEEKSYIGVTSRTIERRMEEHKRDIQQAKLTTALAVEAYNRNIDIKWDNVKQIKPVQDNMMPVITEMLEIWKCFDKEKLVNDRVNWEPSVAWKYALSNH